MEVGQVLIFSSSTTKKFLLCAVQLMPSTASYIIFPLLLLDLPLVVFTPEHQIIRLNRKLLKQIGAGYCCREAIFLYLVHSIHFSQRILSCALSTQLALYLALCP